MNYAKSRSNVKRKKSNKVRKKKEKMGPINYKIFYTVLLLVTIGIVMVFSASSYYALYEHNDVYFFLKKELLWAPLGIGVMIVFMTIDYHKWKALTPVGYFVTAGLLVLVLFSKPINGATRWLPLGPLSFQPSELAKYIMVFYLAMCIERKGKLIERFWKGPVHLLIFPAIFAILILKENNLSITAIVMIVAFIMIFVAGAKVKHMLPIGFVGVIVGFIFIVSEEYRLKRFLTFLNPWKDMAGDGYQIVHSFYALGSGGLLGVGLGNSKQKALYMPEPHNDFIFSIIGEEFGIIGCLLLIAIFAFLVITGIQVAAAAKDRFGKLLATGIISVIAVQCIINIAVVTGSMPVTGVPLPFISYGGTSLVFNLAAMGVLLNISSQSRKEEKLNS